MRDCKGSQEDIPVSTRKAENRIPLIRIVIAVHLALICPVLRAQTAATTPPKMEKTSVTASMPDLSGLWGPMSITPGPITPQTMRSMPEGEVALTWDPSDPMGMRPEKAPMTPWARDRFNTVRPPFGIHETFENVNDPVQKYCDPPGVTRIYDYPWQFTFIQTPDNVYILYEFTRTWRTVAMNRQHPKDPDITWLGDSIGRYDGDTLVIDTVGLNDKTWLDHVGHPHSDALHVIERFRRVNPNMLELALTVDDPKAYTKSMTGKKHFMLSTSPMGETICSASEMESFEKEIMDPTTKPRSK
ncbi:MAG TPA: hypothetical protein VN976_00430 [Verrucomicrobiae bacterium]|nr:hypothetical protein [Verrucomicrobiae bacterium]